jgi:inner membrane transporter RhtA
VLLRLVSASIVLSMLWRPGLRAQRSRRNWALAAAFAVSLAGMNLAFYESIHRIPLGIAVTVEFVGPLTVAVGGSRRPLDLLWVALAASGIIALMQTGGAHGLDGLGVAFAAIAGALWAAYILLNPRVGQAFEGGSGLALAMCIASMLALPLGVAEGGAHLVEPRSLLLGTAVGLLSTAIPYSFELEALRRIATSVFGVLMSLEPGMAAIAGLIVLDQQLSARAVVGIGLVVAASVGASRQAHQPPVAL